MADAPGSSSKNSMLMTEAEDFVIKLREFDHEKMTRNLQRLTDWLMVNYELRGQDDLIEIEELLMRAAAVRIGTDIMSSGSVAEAPSDDNRVSLRRYYQYIENYATVYLTGCIAGSKHAMEKRSDDRRSLVDSSVSKTETQDEKIKRLEFTIVNLDQQKQSFEKGTRDLKGRMEALKAENENLKQEKTDLIAEKENLQEENNFLKSTVQCLVSERAKNNFAAVDKFLEYFRQWNNNSPSYIG